MQWFPWGRTATLLFKSRPSRGRGPLCVGEESVEQRWADESPAILMANHNLVINAGAHNPNRGRKHKQEKGEMSRSRYEQERDERLAGVYS